MSSCTGWKIAILFTCHRWNICSRRSLWCSVIELLNVRASFHGLGFCYSFSFFSLFILNIFSDVAISPAFPVHLCDPLYPCQLYVSHFVLLFLCFPSSAAVFWTLPGFLSVLDIVRPFWICLLFPSFLSLMTAYHYTPLGLILFCYHSTSKSYYNSSGPVFIWIIQYCICWVKTLIVLEEYHLNHKPCTSLWGKIQENYKLI